MQNYIQNYQKVLSSIHKKNCYRSLKSAEKINGKFITYDGKDYLNFSSNDYLGFSQNQKIIQFVKQNLTHLGNCSSRLVTGNHILFENLEKQISQWRGFEETLITTNGYATNIGILSALAATEKETIFFFDELCHASIIDGIFLACSRSPLKCKWHRFKHNNLEDLQKKVTKFLEKNHKTKIKNKTASPIKDAKEIQIIFVTESVFSMNGDIAPIKKIVQLSQKYGAIFYLDEAHSLGVFGKKGEGFSKEISKYKNIITMATMGKSLGNFGAFINCSSEMKEYFINTCRSFIFSTALPSTSLLGCQKAIEILTKGFSHSILKLSDYFRKKLTEKKIPFTDSNSHIICVLTGENQRALNLQKKLMAEKIFAVAIRPPTVKISRIRFTITHWINRKDIDRCLEILKIFFKDVKN